MQQAEAFELLKMGKNIFLTGAAGSGKTHLKGKYSFEWIKVVRLFVELT